LIGAFKRKLTRADPATVVFHGEFIFKPKQKLGGKFTSGDLNVIIFVLAEADLLVWEFV